MPRFTLAMVGDTYFIRPASKGYRGLGPPLGRGGGPLGGFLDEIGGYVKTGAEYVQKVKEVKAEVSQVMADAAAAGVTPADWSVTTRESTLMRLAAMEDVPDWVLLKYGLISQAEMAAAPSWASEPPPASAGVRPVFGEEKIYWDGKSWTILTAPMGKLDWPATWLMWRNSGIPLWFQRQFDRVQRAVDSQTWGEANKILLNLLRYLKMDMYVEDKPAQGVYPGGPIITEMNQALWNQTIEAYNALLPEQFRPITPQTVAVPVNAATTAAIAALAASGQLDITGGAPGDLVAAATAPAKPGPLGIPIWGWIGGAVAAGWLLMGRRR
ncbi:MAG: hypothetical protein V3U45_07090 [bacterium]